jgi:CheY-like chemotaxis protein
VDNSVEAFRILVIDDEEDIHTIAEEAIRAIDGPSPIIVDHALDPRDARKKIRETYFDLVLLDLHRTAGDEVGYGVYRSLDKDKSSVEVLLMTHFQLDPDVMKKIIKLFGAQGGPKFVGFLDKTQQLHTAIYEEVRRRYLPFAATSAVIENLDLPVHLVENRRSRYARPGVFPLRARSQEVAVEIERLLRLLYVKVPAGERQSAVRVSIDPIHRQGMSAAIVVNATVYITFPGVKAEADGHKTVLKIGPKPDILEEAARFQEFVRYGVELDQRVELLGVAEGDSLAALVYSFAGGLHRKELLSLDEALVLGLSSGDLTLSTEVLSRLFKSRHWYSVDAGKADVSSYFSNILRSDLTRSARDGETYLAALAQQLGNGTSFERLPAGADGEARLRLTVPGSVPLFLPDSSILGLGSLQLPATACLIHGDMHGGNVMLETSPNGGDVQADMPMTELHRVCLIDFRNSGPGPRCIDAVALESSIRLSHIESVTRANVRDGESALDPNNRLALAAQMASTVNTELALYRWVFERDASEPTEPWAVLAHHVLSELVECFAGTITLKEYLGCSLRYTFRQLGYPMGALARVRMLAWLSAQYSLVESIANKKQRQRDSGSPAHLRRRPERRR